MPQKNGRVPAARAPRTLETVPAGMPLSAGAHSNGRCGARAGFALAAGLLLLPASPASAECRIETVGRVSPADVERARAGCARAVERFALLFGAPPPSGVVEVSDTVLFFAAAAYHPEWRMVWPTGERLREFFGDTAGENPAAADAVEEQWASVLPHEIGHLLLIAEGERRRPAGVPARRLPDWLHEGVGVWMEPAATRAVEYETLRARRTYVPPLRELMSMSISTLATRGEAGSTIIQTFYPCASEEACAGRPHWSRTFQVRTRHFPDGTVQVDTSFVTGAPPPVTPLGSNFYAYSATLVRFLFDLGGPAAMNALLDRLVGAGSPTRDLDLAGLPGLPATPPRVEAEWRAWFERWILPPAADSAGRTTLPPRNAVRGRPPPAKPLRATATSSVWQARPGS